MKIKFLILTLLFVGMLQSFASKIETIEVFSKSMQKGVTCSVILPDVIELGERLPVVYLLHGHGGNNTTWTHADSVLRMVDDYRLMVVCPDAKTSWYWDSPVDSTLRYETFVAKELVEYVDSTYPTIASNKARAITGLSMGGHGGLYLAIRHQDVFGAAGSTSGGVDIRPFPEKWNMKDNLGEQSANPERWTEYSVMGQLDKLEDGALEIMFDCGDEDFFSEVNKELHRELLERGIEHRYMTSRGKHNWAYWSESIGYQIYFFNSFFRSNM